MNLWFMYTNYKNDVNYMNYINYVKYMNYINYLKYMNHIGAICSNKKRGSPTAQSAQTDAHHRATSR